MTSASQLIKKAQVIRDREHRLKPDLRLKKEAEIVDFIHDKDLVSVLGGNALPSIISAVLGKSWKPSAKGFVGWLDWWSLKIEGRQVRRVIGDIERRNDILATRIVGDTKTFVSNKLWPLIDSIVKHQRLLIAKGEILSAFDLKVLETVKSKGSVRTDQLRRKLKLEGRENNSKFHRSLYNLDAHALIVGAEDPNPERHMHVNIWQTWEKRTGGVETDRSLSHDKALTRLLAKIVDTCVLIRQDQIHRLFDWAADVETAKQELLEKGEIAKAGSYLITSRVLK